MCTREETESVIRDALNEFRTTSEKRRKPTDYTHYATGAGVIGALPLIWSLSSTVDSVSADVQNNYAQLSHKVLEAVSSNNELDREFRKFQIACDARENKYADAITKVQREQEEFRRELVDVKLLIRDSSQSATLYQQRMTQLVSDLREITGTLKDFGVLTSVGINGAVNVKPDTEY